MIEQLNLFGACDQEPEPQQKPPGNTYDNTWWRPLSDYRYNENGRPSGWVKVGKNYIAWVNMDELKRRLYAGYYRTDEQRYSHWGWITAEDLNIYFEPTTRPEWLQNDD